MSKLNKRYGLLLVCLLMLSAGRAQEILSPVGAHPAAASGLKSQMAPVPADTLELPFFDDFSRPGQRPYPKFWTDRLVQINNSWTLSPVTVGMATLDAVDETGDLNGNSEIPFESDFLTSAPINLAYPGRTDIVLSFFYEAGGLGDKPETDDSLVLEFLNVDSNAWERAWAHPGIQEDTFRQVYISIDRERYLKKGFRFRFKNFASLPKTNGYEDFNINVDHWHLDYVYLDTARSAEVTAINDVAMISPLPSLLKSYEAIPWRHFKRAYLTELKPTLEINYRNNDTTVRNVTRKLRMRDLTYDFEHQEDGGAVNVAPGVVNSFELPFNYPFSFYDADSTLFEIKSYLVTEDLDYKWNDTLTRYQRFYNYYAYDDGSAENGYGLRGAGTADAAVAYRFKTAVRDTLRAVQMSFIRTLDDASQNYFILGVWDHDLNLDRPGRLLYRKAGIRPEYGDTLNHFVSYELDTILPVTDVFYVGWINTRELLLNVGWDASNNNQSKIFFNLGQGWQNTGFKGSLMIRPVLGKALRQDVTAVVPVPRHADHVRIYPNPAGTEFRLDWTGSGGPAGLASAGARAEPVHRGSGAGLVNRGTGAGPDPKSGWIRLYNLQGKLMYESPATRESHSVEALKEGIYLLKIYRSGSTPMTRKLIIAR